MRETILNIWASLGLAALCSTPVSWNMAFLLVLLWTVSRARAGVRWTVVRSLVSP